MAPLLRHHLTLKKPNHILFTITTFVAMASSGVSVRTCYISTTRSDRFYIHSIMKPSSRGEFMPTMTLINFPLDHYERLKQNALDHRHSVSGLVLDR